VTAQATATSRTTADDQGTAYHAAVTGFRRVLIRVHVACEEVMRPHQDVVFAARGSRKNPDGGPAVPRPVNDTYLGLMMAAGYSYALAAVLERAVTLNPQIGQKLACLADDVLTNGGSEEICADVWPDGVPRAMDLPPGLEGPPQP
jgi:hypothetical protein